jgi:hypothetical protein
MKDNNTCQIIIHPTNCVLTPQIAGHNLKTNLSLARAIEKDREVIKSPVGIFGI